MSPERTAQVGSYFIEEYYWHGDFVVYVNNTSSDYEFDEAIAYYRSIQ
jgi:hypothetical protein